MMATNTATATAGAFSPLSEAALRQATRRDAAAIHALVAAHLVEGHLLPRTLEELEARAPGFLVADQDGAIVACAELAPLGDGTAEVRSLVVHRDARGSGLGRAMVLALAGRARLEGHSRLCAFTHDPGYFVRQGFSVVPHTWVPEKIAADCRRCPLFRTCGQQAVVLTLGARL
jgi:amino-acid N-acetyltransferase